MTEDKISKKHKAVADTIVYDDDGNIIPLSERFNPEKKDIRYSFKGKKPIEADAKRIEERERMRELERENAKNSVEVKNNMVYNETIGERGVSGEGREAGDSGNKWFSKKIPGESDTESDRAYGKIETGVSEQGSSERLRGASMFGKDSEGRRISERTEKKLKDTSVKNEEGHPIAEEKDEREKEKT